MVGPVLPAHADIQDRVSVSPQRSAQSAWRATGTRHYSPNSNPARRHAIEEQRKHEAETLFDSVCKRDGMPCPNKRCCMWLSCGIGSYSSTWPSAVCRPSRGLHWIALRAGNGERYLDQSSLRQLLVALGHASESDGTQRLLDDADKRYGMARAGRAAAMPGGMLPWCYSLRTGPKMTLEHLLSECDNYCRLSKGMWLAPGPPPFIHAVMECCNATACLACRNICGRD
jgi:hypothetical protein